jgi:hypothetical protein
MGDDRSWNDGDKLSFSERDRRRREGRGPRDERPKGVPKAVSDAVTKQYLKQLDGMFSKTKGGAKVEKLESALRAAHGTPGLADACRAYREAAGVPDDPVLLGLFLDTGEAELVLEALAALRAAHDAGRIKLSAGLRSQLRMLAEDRNRAVAELAEALVARL